MRPLNNFQVGSSNTTCLSACHDQINSVGVTSSDFPNRETFVRREEFCLALKKLMRTCSSEKRIFLEAKFPTVCKNMERIKARIQNRWVEERLSEFKVLRVDKKVSPVPLC